MSPPCSGCNALLDRIDRLLHIQRQLTGEVEVLRSIRESQRQALLAAYRERDAALELAAASAEPGIGWTDGKGRTGL